MSHPDFKIRRSAQRGVAMILAVVAIAVLTVVATEFAYNSRIDLQLATNQRDEIRAYYLARSGIALSRLLLRFQKQIDGMQMPGGSATGTPPGPPGQRPGGAFPGFGGGMTLQLWRMARVDCHMLRQLVREPPPLDRAPLASASTANAAFIDSLGKPAPRSFGGFDGCFLATIGDEEEKLNLNKLDAAQNQILVQRLVDLLTDKRFEFLFEKEDTNKVKTSALDVLVAIRDWIDEDEVQSTLNLASLGVGGAGVGDAFVRGFTDENSQYDRYSPRYKAKNARLDSLDELYMVHGVNDRVMAAFRDRFTVYPDVNAKLNINTEDPLLLQMAILSVADPSHPDPRLHDPVFVDALIQRIRSARMMSFLGMSVTDFISVIESSGVPVNPLIRNNVQNNTAVSDKTNTFNIKSVGEAGSVQKTISAVVRMDDQGLGRLVYWREE